MDTFNVWDAFNHSRAAADTSNLAGLQGQAQAVTIAGALHKLQLENQFRNEINSAKTPEERSAVAAKYASPADIFKRDTESADQKSKTDATKEMARGRLQQAAQQFNQTMDLRIGAAKTAQEKLLLEQQKAQGMMQLQAVHAQQVGEANTYNFGIPKTDIATPQITVGKPAATSVAAPPGVQVADTVSPAEIQRIQDPAERAQAMAAMQGGQTYSPQGAPAPAAPAMPPEAPIAPPASPVAAPAAIPPQGDMRDVMAERGQFGSNLQSQLGPRPAPAIAAQLGPQPPLPAPIASQAPGAAKPAIPPMPPEVAALPPKLRDQWVAQQGKANAAGSLGNRESVFINRVVLSGNEAAKDLENVVQLPMSASRGMFGGRGQVEGIFNAGKETLANKMTTQDVQSYNVLSAGFQRSLAAIEAAGLAPSGTLSHQMDAVIFKEGDSNFTKLQKLAQTRQIVEAGLESMATNPRVPPETKDHIQTIINKISKSVPFTQSDLIRLQQQQQINPKITLKDIVGKLGRTGEPAPEGVDHKVWGVMTPDEKKLWQTSH